MAWKFVKQPNGKLARWSDVVDDFTHTGLAYKEAVFICIHDHGMTPTAAATKVAAGVEDHKPWTNGIKGSGLDRWNDCVDTIERVHGKEKRAIREKCCT